MSFSFTLSDVAAAKAPELSEAGKVDGRDILFAEGNLQASPSGDWATVEGRANLKKAILRRLTTRPGEFRPRPEYGIGAQTFVKKLASRANLDELQQRIVANLPRDVRITDVIDVEIASEFLAGTDKRIFRATIRVNAKGQELRLQALDIGEVV